MSITWAQALGWRMRRQFLVPPGGPDVTVEDVVERLGALPAWSGDPEFAVRVRRERSGPGEVDAAVADGRLVRVFAFRGATHLMTPDLAGAHLALRAAGRMWERASWQEHYRLAPQDWADLRQAVRDAVADGPITLPELGLAVAGRQRYRHLRGDLSTAGTFLKPFFWQGDLCFAPTHDGEPAVQALAANPRWAGIPDLDDAGRRAVTAYLSTYGPATPGHLHYWLGEGLGAGRRRVDGWLEDLADGLDQVDVEGVPALVPTDLFEDLRQAEPTRATRFLTRHDQWVLGPGTADPHVVPPGQRAAVTRGANLVLAGGVVAGTWKASGPDLVVSWFPGAESPREDLADEAGRVGAILGRPLEVRVGTS